MSQFGAAVAAQRRRATLEDFVPVQRRPELDAALHQQAEGLVAVLEPLHEQPVLERAGHHLAHAQQEVPVSA